MRLKGRMGKKGVKMMGWKIIIKSMNQSIPSDSAEGFEAAVGTVLTGYLYRIAALRIQNGWIEG